MLRWPAQPALEARTTILRPSRLASGEHLRMRKEASSRTSIVA
jgi:hypothetical protein